MFPVVSPTEGILGDPNPDWMVVLVQFLHTKTSPYQLNLKLHESDHWTGTEGVLKYFGIHPETANISTATQDMPTYGGRTIAAGDTFRGNIYDFGGGPVALDADWYTAEGGGFGNQSETFVQDASWVELRVTLGYDLPFKTASSIGFDSISFAVSGRNLALWTDIEGFDPDINNFGATLGRGLDYFTNPATQSYAFTVKLGFLKLYNIEKHKFKYLFLSLLSLAIVSCGEFTDGINDDPNNFTGAPGDLLIGQANLEVVKLSGSNASRYSGIFTDQFTGADRQYISLDNYTTTAADYDDEWDDLYADGLARARLAEQGAVESGDVVLEGVAQIVQGLLLELLLYGVMFLLLKL